jgi:hypothetical protein
MRHAALPTARESAHGQGPGHICNSYAMRVHDPSNRLEWHAMRGRRPDGQQRLRSLARTVDRC